MQTNTKQINENENKCKGKWTREQGEEKSIIDYVITSQEYMETMEIDGDRWKKTMRIIQNRTPKHTLITMLYKWI